MFSTTTVGDAVVWKSWACGVNLLGCFWLGFDEVRNVDEVWCGRACSKEAHTVRSVGIHTAAETVRGWWLAGRGAGSPTWLHIPGNCSWVYLRTRFCCWGSFWGKEKTLLRIVMIGETNVVETQTPQLSNVLPHPQPDTQTSLLLTLWRFSSLKSYFSSDIASIKLKPFILCVSPNMWNLVRAPS